MGRPETRNGRNVYPPGGLYPRVFLTIHLLIRNSFNGPKFHTNKIYYCSQDITTTLAPNSKFRAI